MPQNDALFNTQEWLRYTRHIQLSGFGVSGQSRLKKSHVLMIGAGGLGAPVGLYLAAAGVGKLSIVDADVVDLTNLQRQVIYTEKDVGKEKANVSRERLRALNSDIDVHAVAERFTCENADTLLTGIDIVLDCTDNFSTRYLINDMCTKHGVPWVYASVHQYSGQCAFFDVDGPCFRCIFPEAPDNVEDCNSAGVLGSVPGLLALFQTQVCLAYLSGQSLPLKNQLMLFDATTLTQHKMAMTKNKECCCQNGRDIDIVSDAYLPSVCGVEMLEGIEISATEFHQARERCLVLDVREDDERKAFHIGGEHVPLSSLDTLAENLPRDKTLLCYCQSGIRSLAAAQRLAELGMKVLSVRGGLVAILKTGGKLE